MLRVRKTLFHLGILQNLVKYAPIITPGVLCIPIFSEDTRAGFYAFRALGVKPPPRPVWHAPLHCADLKMGEFPHLGRCRPDFLFRV